MVFVCGKRSCDPDTFILSIRLYGTAFCDVSVSVIDQTVHHAHSGGSFRHVMFFIILILKFISLWVRDPGQVTVFIIFKLCGIFLGIHGRDYIVFVIIGVALSEFFPVQGKSVKKCKVGISAVSIGNLNAGIVLLCHINVTQELPVKNIRAEICIMNVIFSVCPYKNHFYAKAAVFIIICFRKTGSPTPGINHVSVSFFACEIKEFCKTLIYLSIAYETVYIFIQPAYSFGNYGYRTFINFCCHIQLAVTCIQKTEISSALYCIPFLISCQANSTHCNFLTCF